MKTFIFVLLALCSVSAPSMAANIQSTTIQLQAEEIPAQHLAELYCEIAIEYGITFDLAKHEHENGLISIQSLPGEAEVYEVTRDGGITTIVLDESF